MKKYTIQDLKNGKVALYNDVTAEELESIAEKLDWLDATPVSGYYYYRCFDEEGQICGYDYSRKAPFFIPIQHGSEFLKELEGKETTRTFETGSMRDDDSDKPLVNHLDAYLRLRFGYLLRQGAKKYSKGNWRLLQPKETALESLHRHLAKYELNLQNNVEQDEDHLSSIVFNVMLLMKQEEKEGISVDQFYGTMK